MKIGFLCCSLLLFALTPASLAQSPCHAENDGGNFTDNMSMGGPGLLLGVEFVAPADLSVSSIEVFTGEVTGLNTVGIWAHDPANNWPGTDLGTGSWNMDINNSWQGASLPAEVPLTAGTTYWMVWGAQNSSQASVEGGTTLGQVYRGSFDGGASWNGPWQSDTHQWKFRLYCGGGPGTAYCFGDLGSGTPCPCGNDNDGSVPESGCANGVFASGAQLTGTGTASLAADTLVLSTTGQEPNNSGLYFQADNDLSPGNIWGDGLQCAGGQLKRLGVRFADGTGASDTSGFALSISVKAGNILAGDTKYYQCWYRNTINPPCGAGVNDFNASNGYAVTWTP